MSSIYLVSCVSKKADTATVARDLYISPWFRKARAHVERQGISAWYILSAEYGLVAPDDVIEPYERTLNRMPIAERRAWAVSVLHRLGPLTSATHTISFYAGQRYREFLVDPLKNSGKAIDIPLQGMRIGEQLRWFNRQATSLQQCSAS